MTSLTADKPDAAAVAKPDRVRGIRTRTRGTPMGPVMRLVDPQGLGEILKPFVFLDLAELPPGPSGAMRWHPHSGIATLTIVLEGQNEYRETTGVRGGLKAGGLEWMASGRGVWHTASAVGDRSLKGFQVWMLLPPGADMAPPASVYLDSEDVPARDGVRVILGVWDGIASGLPGVPDATLLDVSLKAGEPWVFTPTGGQTLAWAAVHSGVLTYGGQRLAAGDLVVFDDGDGPLAFETGAGAGFILGAARRSSHDLFVGRSSVHVSAEALAAGEAEIGRLHARMRVDGLIR